MLKKGIIIGLVSVGVLASAAVAGKMYINNKMDKIDKVEIPKEEVHVNDTVLHEKLEGYTNIALFGVDTREGKLEKGTRTDTIMIASINNSTSDIKLVSVYRDTYLDLAAEGKTVYNKANTAYSQGGPKQAIDMLNKNLDLNITDYVTVDFVAITKVVDLLGGIDIEITDEERVHLNNYAIETSKVTGVKTKEIPEPGLVHLDGVQATSYARIRYTAGDDYKRTERQRLIIEKLFEKAKKMDFATLNSILDEVLPLVSTSLSSSEIIKLGTNALNYDLTDQVGFPFTVKAESISGKGACVLPDDLETNVVELHKLLFGIESYAPSSTVKEISDTIAGDASGTKSDDKSNDKEEGTKANPQKENQESEKNNANKNNGSKGNSGSKGSSPNSPSDDGVKEDLGTPQTPAPVEPGDGDGGAVPSPEPTPPPSEGNSESGTDAGNFPVS